MIPGPQPHNQIGTLQDALDRIHGRLPIDELQEFLQAVAELGPPVGKLLVERSVTRSEAEPIREGFRRLLRSLKPTLDEVMEAKR